MKSPGMTYNQEKQPIDVLQVDKEPIFVQERPIPLLPQRIGNAKVIWKVHEKFEAYSHRHTIC